MTTVKEITAAAACPDCNSVASLLQVRTNVYVLAIEHDDTCPLHPIPARVTR